MAAKTAGVGDGEINTRQCGAGFFTGFILFKLFPVAEDHRKLLGCVTTKQIKEIPREEWSSKLVKDLAVRCSEENTIAPDADAVEALSTMRRNNAGRLMVVEGDKLVGIIAMKDMLEFLALKVELDT